MSSSATASNFLNRPANTAFRQQRLQSWQPILIPKTVLPALFVIGLVFIPIGIGLYIVTSHVKEFKMDYTTCSTNAPSTLSAAPASAYPLTQWMYSNGDCTLEFEITETLDAPVFMYYELTNFYQNHRRYVKSIDSSQLRGDSVSTGSLDSNCGPLRYAKNVPNNPFGDMVTVNGQNVTVRSDAQVYPCGLIANSMFSDDIGFDLSCVEGCNSGYSFTDKGIALATERDKFKPTGWNKTLQGSDLTVYLVPPPMWRSAWPDKWAGGYTNENLPDIQHWPRLQVWMRNAALPNFRKLWGRNDDQSLEAGRYTITITEHFDTTTYAGTKSLVIATVSVLGGRNPFLGVTYIAVGGACWVVGLLFLIRHVLRPRKLGDYSYLSWNQPEAAAAGDAAARATGAVH